MAYRFLRPLINKFPAQAFRSFSTEAPKETPIFNSLNLAIIGLSGFGFYQAVSLLSDVNEGKQFFEMEQFQEVENQEELNKVRMERLMDGLKEAFIGAGEWGLGAGLVLGGLRWAEEPYFKSTALKNLGTPRLVLLTMFLSTCGFAIRGETKLIKQARKPLRVKTQ